MPICQHSLKDKFIIGAVTIGILYLQLERAIRYRNNVQRYSTAVPLSFNIRGMKSLECENSVRHALRSVGQVVEISLVSYRMKRVDVLVEHGTDHKVLSGALLNAGFESRESVLTKTSGPKTIKIKFKGNIDLQFMDILN